MAELWDASEFEARYTFDRIRVSSQFDEFPTRSRAERGRSASLTRRARRMSEEGPGRMAPRAEPSACLRIVRREGGLSGREGAHRAPEAM